MSNVGKDWVDPLATIWRHYHPKLAPDSAPAEVPECAPARHYERI